MQQDKAIKNCKNTKLNAAINPLLGHTFLITAQVAHENITIPEQDYCFTCYSIVLIISQLLNFVVFVLPSHIFETIPTHLIMQRSSALPHAKTESNKQYHFK